MLDLFQLLKLYPILDSLVRQISFGDLLNLSRVNSKYRVALRDLPDSAEDITKIEGSNVRKALFIGGPDTPHWRYLKSVSQFMCAEAGHTKGSQPRGCRLCSIPVCCSCTVKAAFQKKYNAFANRKRQLCEDCWLSGNPHTEALQYATDASILRNYDKSNMCRCTADDAYLCSTCRERLSDAVKVSHSCAGKGCSNSIKDGHTGRVCIWCNLTLPVMRDYKDRPTRFLTNIYKYEPQEPLPPLTPPDRGVTDFWDQRVLLIRREQQPEIRDSTTS